jgi:fructose-1,6-bisphosphatase/inositol monophosphatase family enzyme
VLEELPTRAEREPVVGDGEGGDETTAVDAAAEQVILARLQEVEGTTIVSRRSASSATAPPGSWSTRSTAP